MPSAARRRLIYFSPVAWDSYDQRPHAFVRHFLRAEGGEAWWFNPYPARLARWSDIAREDLGRTALAAPRPAGLTVVDAGGWPIDPLPGGARVNRVMFWRDALRQVADLAARDDTIVGIGRPTALAAAALRASRPAWSFYDAMDDFPLFYDGLSRRATERVERAIARAVDRIFASSPRLARKFDGTGPPVTLVPNAFDMALLDPVGPAEAPGAPGGARRGPPAIGFVGCMGRWFDWTLVGRLASAIAPMPVRLIGPRPTRPASPLPANVEYLPPCGAREAVTALGAVSAGLIPFTRTALTESVDPIKFYLYRAAGLPVLSTRFGTMAGRTVADGVFFLDAPDDHGPAGADALAAIVRTAMAGRPTPDAIRAFRGAHDWRARLHDVFASPPPQDVFK